MHYPADLFYNFHKIEPLKQLVAGAPGKLDKLPVVADVSFSGPYLAAERQIKYILRNYRTAKMIFIINHGMTNAGIENLISDYEKDVDIEFMLSGVLPEEYPATIEESFGCSPENLTKRVIKRATDLGLAGIYGSAAYASLDRGSLQYIGAGISYDGGIYKSGGIEKMSTELEVAVPNCDQINIGSLITDHPDGAIAGLELLKRRLSAISTRPD